VKIDEKSTLQEVAAVVSEALEAAGIRAVLTGGGIATIHSRGDYMSEDLDFIVQSAPTRAQLDAALRPIGFVRRRDHYEHAISPFFLEFPRGPLSIGRDLAVQPERVSVGRRHLLGLSPTDSCRDRLAAFYFWNDRQSLDVAVRIALRSAVDLKLIRQWSEAEGHTTRFGEFDRLLTEGRRRRTGGRKRGGRK
jgi:hypothetical protein